MRVVYPNELYELRDTDITVFMAGGMGNTAWHDKFLGTLQSLDTNNLVVFNPYNAEIDSEYQQIIWEINRIKSCDIFSIYFDKYTQQPASMYELGYFIASQSENKLDLYRNDELIQTVKYGGKPYVISINPERDNNRDLIIRCGIEHFSSKERTLEEHAQTVYEEYRRLLNERFGESANWSLRNHD